jgi:hypothetical protein
MTVPIKYPKLPTSVEGPGGAITVAVVPAPLKLSDTEVWGCWDEADRAIKVSDDIPPRMRWKVYFHELTHVAITDSGLDEMISNELHEAICEAVAVARMRERFG